MRRVGRACRPPTVRAPPRAALLAALRAEVCYAAAMDLLHAPLNVSCHDYAQIYLPASSLAGCGSWGVLWLYGRPPRHCQYIFCVRCSAPRTIFLRLRKGDRRMLRTVRQVLAPGHLFTRRRSRPRRRLRTSKQIDQLWQPGEPGLHPHGWAGPCRVPAFRSVPHLRSPHLRSSACPA